MFNENSKKPHSEQVSLALIGCLLVLVPQALTSMGIIQNPWLALFYWIGVFLFIHILIFDSPLSYKWKNKIKWIFSGVAFLGILFLILNGFKNTPKATSAEEQTNKTRDEICSKLDNFLASSVPVYNSFFDKSLPVSMMIKRSWDWRSNVLNYLNSLGPAYGNYTLEFQSTVLEPNKILTFKGMPRSAVVDFNLTNLKILTIGNIKKEIRCQLENIPPLMKLEDIEPKGQANIQHFAN